MSNYFFIDKLSYYLKHAKSTVSLWYPLRVYPIDTYAIPAILLRKCTSYHFLRVPLIGQYNTAAQYEDHCSRTSATMLYNWHRLAAGQVSCKDDYITMWDNGSGVASDMVFRYSDGDVAFPNSKFDKLCNDYNVNSTPLIIFNHTGADRVAVAAQICKDNKRLETYLKPIKEMLLKNNPALIRTGLSSNKKTPQHFLVICGFCYIADSDTKKENLWLLIADPSTLNSKISGGMYNIIPDANKPNRSEDNDTNVDYELLDGLKEEHDIIRIITGNKYKSRASLYLIRARKLFEENKFSTGMKADLYFDYFYDGATKQGGYYQCRQVDTKAPPELILSSSTVTATFPLASKISFESPLKYYHANEMNLQAVGGYYGLGLNRNVHGGIHLCPEEKKRTAVRCTAAGYVVAARLPAEDTDVVAWNYRVTN